MFTELQKKPSALLPAWHEVLGDPVVIDGSPIDAVLSMHLAGYRSPSRSANLHLDFNLSQSMLGNRFDRRQGSVAGKDENHTQLPNQKIMSKNMLFIVNDSFFTSKR